ncbi:hypothetical protein Bca4012_010364 [Brassica carinata]|uniref:Uncharacterized protein n=1 Tax=Brassica carinata TaxID=52824 RepID=A0A8X7V1L0_BRACI|nr:hypothetical protein Bca52824_035316 [Brassica carinata]
MSEEEERGDCTEDYHRRVDICNELPLSFAAKGEIFYVDCGGMERSHDCRGTEKSLDCGGAERRLNRRRKRR